MENKAVASCTNAKASENVRDWSSLQADMLVQIFALLSVMDRVLNVSKVCRSWWSACANKIFWGTFDTSEIMKEIYPRTPRERSQLMLILIRGVNLAGENLTTLVIDSTLEVNDRILIHAARRCPNLTYVGLPWPYGTTANGLRTAFKSWTHLQSMSISLYSLLPYANIFRVVGQNCPNFIDLKVYASFVSRETAEITSRFLPRLKVLSLHCSMVSKEAADVVLDGMHELEELYISIQKVVSVGLFTSVFHPAIMHDPGVLRKASRLRVYRVCYAGECNSCPASSMRPPP